MSVGPGEPEIQQWKIVSIFELAEMMIDTKSKSEPGPSLVAVDGRSGSGKTTLANRLLNIIPHSAIVHTDDIAWYYSFFGWDKLMIEGVLKPLRKGRGVSYRPLAWEKRNRPGAIVINSDCKMVIVKVLEQVESKWHHG